MDYLPLQWKNLRILQPLPPFLHVLSGLFLPHIQKCRSDASDDILARLISMPNVIVTSHQAFLTEEALENIAETTVRNIIDFTENGECPNEIFYSK